MRPTIDDVAARAGVSTATVSRALRGLSNVSEQARAKVLAAAEELGYVVSPSAQALATGRTNTVATVVPAFDEWFPSHALEGAQRRLQARGYTTIVHCSPISRGPTSVDLDVESLRGRIDGLMVISVPVVEEEQTRVDELEVPVIVVGNANPPIASVTLDDVEAAELATGHLVELGHTVIGHITGSRNEISSYMPGGARLEGWRRAMEGAGLEADDDLYEHAYFDIAGGRDAMMELLGRRPDLTAVFAASDSIALGAMEAAKERGLRVPQDISVIGIDGEFPESLLPLTTVVQDPALIGRIAADSLLRMVDGGAVDVTQTVHGTLRRGRTTSVVRR